MKTLWTPWRMKHVCSENPPSGRCLFEPPGDNTFSKRHLLLYRDTHALCILNQFPYTNGHLLVAPRKHVCCITELTNNDMTPLMELVSRATTILKKHLNPTGFNIGLNIGTDGGAGIADHLHFHIVPRWRGDHNFITVLAETRTIPEHISVTFDRLLPDFQLFHQEKYS
jgi:ATP adenylyltransferase